MLIVTWFSHLAAAPIASWYEFERLEFSSKSLSISVDCESICQQDDKPNTPSDEIYTAKVLFFFVNKRIYRAKFGYREFTSIRSFCLLLSNLSMAKAISCNCLSSFCLSSWDLENSKQHLTKAN